MKGTDEESLRKDSYTIDFNFEVVSHMSKSCHCLKQKIFYELTNVETVINNSLEVSTPQFRYLQVTAKKGKPNNRRINSLHVSTERCSDFYSQRKNESHWFKSLSL